MGGRRARPSAVGPAAGPAGRRLAPGDRLPGAVAAALGGGPSPWRVGRESVVVVLLEAADRTAPGYVRGLAAAEPAFRAWDGRAFVLANGARGELPGEDAAGWLSAVLPDPGGRARTALGFPPGAAALVVADRWGQVYHAAVADAAAGLPTPAELEEWFRFLATQCPECGVPDEPGRGEWSA